jgi:hypothetical protein
LSANDAAKDSGTQLDNDGTTAGRVVSPPVGADQFCDARAVDLANKFNAHGVSFGKEVSSPRKGKSVFLFSLPHGFKAYRVFSLVNPCQRFTRQ